MPLHTAKRCAMIKPMAQDTIAALATPPGNGALAVLRVSGSTARAVVEACTGGRRLEPRRATLLRVRDAAGHTLDTAVATLFAAPASFTGEDVVELTCHGGMLVCARVLERLLNCGARPAEPGEFSRRAFENGKMDLTQAEAIMDVIAAGSDWALRAAQDQLGGALSAQVRAALDSLLDVAAQLVAYIDFPEEDIEPATAEALLAQLRELRADLGALLATATEGRILREGIATAIIGAPNVGKSSLLNLLAGYERAIVSPRAGTTRDTVEERVLLGGLCLRLTDTAGLHESADALEREGMERSRRAGAAADLIIEVADSSQPRPAPLPAFAGVPRLLLLNKCDLPTHPDWAGSEGLRFSCRTGAGREELAAAVRGLFLHRGESADTLVAVNARHRYALQQALEELSRAEESLRAGEPPELTDVFLRGALDALGSITGQVDTEDVLDRVFSTFCLGK